MNQTTTRRAFSRLALLAALTLGVALASWSTGSDSALAATREEVSSSAESCPVTQPQEGVPGVHAGYNYGNGALDVNLWPTGTLTPGRLPGGARYAELQPNGSIVAKLGWWREASGKLSIEGERLDAAAAPLRARIPDGYGPRGFQSTLLTFPTAGCWRVVGSVAGSRLMFVVRVLAPRPSEPAPPAKTSPDAWTRLRRPLHLPRLRPGAHCPVSSVDRRVDWDRTNIFGGSGIGPGPVYPGLGYSRGVLRATPDRQFGGPWAGTKVFWYVLPSYRGRALIRGRQLDGGQTLGFDGDRRPERELRIEPYDTVSWHAQPRGSRGIPTSVRVRVPGCYGVQIDGTRFSRVVVFRAAVS